MCRRLSCKRFTSRRSAWDLRALARSPAVCLRGLRNFFKRVSFRLEVFVPFAGNGSDVVDDVGVVVVDASRGTDDNFSRPRWAASPGSSGGGQPGNRLGDRPRC